MLEQCDALEFVNKLEGGWNCIVLDPPYHTKESGHVISMEGLDKTKAEKLGKKWVSSLDLQKRMQIEKGYVEKLIQAVNEKKAEQGFTLRFFNRELPAEWCIYWYKTKGGMGGHIHWNMEYVMIDSWGGIRPDIFHPLNKIEEHLRRTCNNQYVTHFLPLTKPVSLYRKLFRFTKASYVLDPFAGSFNSARAATALGLKIDACDKYLEPKVAQKTLLEMI